MEHFDFELNKREGIIEIYLDDISNPIYIEMDKFYLWMSKSVSLCIPMDEYFNLNYDILKKDLINYYLKVLLKQ